MDVSAFGVDLAVLLLDLDGEDIGQLDFAPGELGKGVAAAGDGLGRRDQPSSFGFIEGSDSHREPP